MFRLFIFTTCVIILSKGGDYMFDISAILNGVSIAVISSGLIAILTFLIKRLKNKTFRSNFYKRFVFYDSLLGLLLFTCDFFVLSSYPKWLLTVVFLLSLFNVIYTFENVMYKNNNNNNRS